MPGVAARGSALYRFGKRYDLGLRQSARPPTVYRILPSPLPGQVGPPPRLQPAWLLGRGCASPWSSGRPCRARRTPMSAAEQSQLRVGAPRLELDKGDDGASAQDSGCSGGDTAPRDADRQYRDAAPPTLTPGQHPRLSYDRALIQVQLTPPEHACDAASERARRRGGGDITRPAAAPCSQMSIGHLNVRSLSSKLDEINLLLSDHKLDILCLSETWLTPQVLDTFLVFPG